MSRARRGARGTSRRVSQRSFYERALDAAEQDDLADARRIEGLDEEVALLRLRLRDALEQHPEDFRLLQGGARLLIQALLARHRLSPKQADNLGEAVTNLLEEFGQVLGSAGEGDPS